VTTSSLRNGELILHQDGLPLLARQSWGRGNVFYLALDPKLAPLDDWDGRETVWDPVALAAPELPVWGLGAQNGFSAGSAVESLPSLVLPSAVGLMAFLMCYVIIVGPVNYLVLLRMKRRELAWLTIPAIVLLCSASSYIAGFQLKGNDVILNQMSIAYGRSDGPLMRVQSLVGLYSPRRDVFDVSFPAGTLVRPFDRNAGSLSGGGNTGPVVQQDEVTVQEVRLDVSEVSTFVADSVQPTLAIAGETTLRMDGSRVFLDIEVQNNSEVTLENAGLLIGSTMVSLGNIEPGESRAQSAPLTSEQVGAAVGGPAMAGPVYGGVNPLTQHAAMLLGTNDYYNDREAYPRWQLLQSLSNEYGVTAGSVPLGTATLVGWADVEQVTPSLGTTSADHLATTLYLLELPFGQAIAGGQGLIVPEALVNWTVLGESGTYGATPNDLYLPAGWVEFEFKPWPQFASMEARSLEIVLTEANGYSGQTLPQVRLWDWEEEIWVEQTDVEWGRTPVKTAERFLGEENEVRIRLQNDELTSIQIREIRPRLVGDLE
jgi:hypothetical protein